MMNQGKQSASQMIQRVHGDRGVQAAVNASRRWGRETGAAVTSYLSRAGQQGMRALESSKPILDRVNQQVRDPRKRQQIALGVMAAAGAAYYIHTHHNEVKYNVINYGLEQTKVPVNGQQVPLKNVITSAVLRQAPYLEGTKLAEDPAAVLAYGVVAVGREDMMNRMEIIPRRPGPPDHGQSRYSPGPGSGPGH